jgi:hypothetical protein
MILHSNTYLNTPKTRFPSTCELKRLEEIPVCGGVVFILSVQDAGLGIELGLEVRGTVDWVWRPITSMLGLR